MTRKDFELIAAALRRAKDAIDYESGEGTGWLEATHYIMLALEENNESFDDNRFLRAAHGWNYGYTMIPKEV